MFTTIDKFLVAMVMGAIFLLNTFTNFHFGVDEDTVAAVVSLITPIFVYLMPNVEKEV